MTNRPGCVSAHRPRKGTVQRAVRGAGKETPSAENRSRGKGPQVTLQKEILQETPYE
jgi:hypothetical protein